MKEERMSGLGSVVHSNGQSKLNLSWKVTVKAWIFQRTSLEFSLVMVSA